QISCGSDPETNLERGIQQIREAAKQGAKVICLPELFKSVYFCQAEEHANFGLAEGIPGPTTQRLGALARELEVVLIVPLFERRAPGIYHNAAAVIDSDGRYLGKYRKMHIPEDPLYYEKFYFVPGDLGFRTFDTRFGRIGVLICWDQWYPEAARLTALAGAQIIFFPTAIGWHPRERVENGESQLAAWQTIQRSHAIANGLYVAAVNRVGHEGENRPGGIDFWGSSFVCDPSGSVMRAASDEREEILVAECDLQKVDLTRTHWPFLRDRRLDAYGDLSKRYLDTD
ncbi:MAG TPA: carbon-nitrogen hydrolase, partial [Acidobacteriota bacterium]|nr:carbon-nitrogen hydrolase [Acidobacteriota bacterium]